MGDHEDTVRILELELGLVEQAFRGLSEEDWRAPTKLRPLDEAKPPWTLFELDGGRAAARPGRRRPGLGAGGVGAGPAHPDPRLPLIG